VPKAGGEEGRIGKDCRTREVEELVYVLVALFSFRAACISLFLRVLSPDSVELA
jgi:hypothetical protein